MFEAFVSFEGLMEFASSRSLDHELALKVIGHNYGKQGMGIWTQAANVRNANARFSILQGP